MPRRVYADIPGHKKFDADLSSLGSLAKRLAEDAESKLAKAKTDKERQGFELLARELAAMTSKARDLRHTLWEATE